MTQIEIREALLKAFTHAIETMGLAAFKATSFFGTSDREAKAEKRAA